MSGSQPPPSPDDGTSGSSSGSGSGDCSDSDSSESVSNGINMVHSGTEQPEHEKSESPSGEDKSVTCSAIIERLGFAAC